jgi:hypothetical protein
VVDDFLELSGRSAALSGSQVRLAAFVHIVEAGTIVEEHHLAQFDGGGACNAFKRLSVSNSRLFYEQMQLRQELPPTPNLTRSS